LSSNLLLSALLSFLVAVRLAIVLAINLLSVIVVVLAINDKHFLFLKDMPTDLQWNIMLERDILNY